LLIVEVKLDSDGRSREKFVSRTQSRQFLTRVWLITNERVLSLWRLVTNKWVLSLWRLVTSRRTPGSLWCNSVSVTRSLAVLWLGWISDGAINTVCWADDVNGISIYAPHFTEIPSLIQTHTEIECISMKWIKFIFQQIPW